MSDDLKECLIFEIEKLRGLEVRDSPLGPRSAVVFEGKDVAHFHNANEIDVRLTKKQIRKLGLAHPADSKAHPNRSENSPWIELRYKSAAEVRKVAALIKLATEVI